MVGWGSLGTLLLTLATAGLVALPGRSGGAAQKAGDLPKPENKTLTTGDDGALHITYYKSLAEEDAPVIVLLHMKDGNRFVWQGDTGFAQRLQKEGYAVITVDLRFHGESKFGGAPAATNVNQGAGKKKDKKKSGIDLRPADLETMVELDMEAVKAFIKEEHQVKHLNMNKMGIVGPEMGASVAVAYAALDWSKEPYDDAPDERLRTPRGQDVRAMVLISPQEKFKSMAMARVITQLKNPDFNISFLICSGNEATDKKESEKVFDMVIKPDINKKRMFLKSYPARVTGTKLLNENLGIEDYMLVFFDEHLKKIDSPWRDRRSRREKLDKKK
jgi:pimeloyl-ACP methyl ester carboxylesterase